MSLLGSLLNVGGLTASAYLPYEQAGQTMSDIQAATSGFQQGAYDLGQTATSGLNFTPFSVTTGAGTGMFDQSGGMTTQLSPEYQQLASMMQNQALQTGQYQPQNLAELQQFGSGALGGSQFMLGQSLGQDPYLQSLRNQSLQGAQAQQAAAMGIDPSQYQALQNQALFQAQQGLETGGPSQAELFQQMQNARAGTQERDRLALENRLAAQGRLGVQTAAFGGTPEQLAMEKAFQEQASQDFLSATQLADQLRSSNIAQSTNLFGLGAQAGMTPLQQQAMGLQNAGALQGMGLNAQQTDLARQLQQQQMAQGMFGLSSQAQSLPLSLQGLNQQNLTQQLQNAFLPEQQLLTSLSPSLGLQNIISGYDTAQANALTQLGMAGLEAEMGGLSSVSQLESARVNALADALQGLFGATAGAESPIDSLITSLLTGSGG